MEIIYYKKSNREITSRKQYDESSKFANKVLRGFTIGTLALMSLLQGIYSINPESFERNPFTIWIGILIFIIIWAVFRIIIYYDNSEIKYQKWVKC